MVPASRSYGIQVAQRAGVPAAVIRQASRELERLEAQGAPTPQLGLFAAAAQADAQSAAQSAAAQESEDAAGLARRAGRRRSGQPGHRAKPWKRCYRLKAQLP